MPETSAAPPVIETVLPPKGWWARVYHWLFDLNNAKGHATTIENSIGWLIILSVVAIIAEHNTVIESQYGLTLMVFDVLSVGVFTLEYLLRLGASAHDPEYAGRSWARVRYFFSPYALIDLIAIAPFYFASVVALDVEMMRLLRLMRLMRIFKLSRYAIPAWQEFQSLNAHRSFRAKVYALLEPTGHSGKLRTYVDNFIMFWVLVSIVSVVLESVESVQQAMAFEFHVIDVFSFSIFTLEYAARLYSAPENPQWRHHWLPRLTYARSGPALIDLAAILPFLLERFLPFDMDLRFLRVFRLARLLKLTRYTSATATLYKVVRREWQVIMAAVFVMMLLVVLTASMGYIFEHEAQPDKFENIPQSIYWAVVTLASVGYGDISPITPMGRALTVVLALLGIGIFAIPAGLLASAFTDQLRIEREAFKAKLLHAYHHEGKLDAKARAILAEETERLHLSAEDIKRLTEEAKASFEDQKNEERKQIRAIVIDPQVHPELAYDQLRLLVQQLKLISQASGAEQLMSHIDPHHVDAELTRQVLMLMRSQASDITSDS
jgi:voltage-gated potassium channel Kch